MVHPENIKSNRVNANYLLNKQQRISNYQNFIKSDSFWATHMDHFIYISYRTVNASFKQLTCVLT